MRVLTVEFASSCFMGGVNEDILIEGFSMLRLVSDGLKRAGNEVFTLLGKDTRNLNRVGLGVIPVSDSSSVLEVVDESNPDYVFPIAPDLELAGIVETLTSRGIRCISSDVGAIRAAADKLETYRILRGRGIDIPETLILGEDMRLDFPLITKDRHGVACCGIHKIDGKEELAEIPSDSGNILQEFIQGESASVTLFSNGRKAIPISLNKQEVEFKQGKAAYLGGEVPFEHPLKDEAFETARKAVESIPGLKGCIGVDMILADKPYVIEINPRVTTSMIALELASGLNVGESALGSFFGDLPEQPEFSRRIRFRKEFSGGVCSGLRFEDMK